MSVTELVWYVCVCVFVYLDEEDVLYRLCELEESSDDVLEESYTQVSRKQASQVTNTSFYFYTIYANWFTCLE